MEATIRLSGVKQVGGVHSHPGKGWNPAGLPVQTSHKCTFQREKKTALPSLLAPPGQLVFLMAEVLCF